MRLRDFAGVCVRVWMRKSVCEGAGVCGCMFEGVG
jgi:hypothetical protein